jgi:hypothetical protein
VLTAEMQRDYLAKVSMDTWRNARPPVPARAAAEYATKARRWSPEPPEQLWAKTALR